jgi:hypothetical protein
MYFSQHPQGEIVVPLENRKRMTMWTRVEYPYCYGLTLEVLDHEAASALLYELDRVESWRRECRSFYKVDVLDRISCLADVLRQPPVKAALRIANDFARSTFGVPVACKAKLHIHRYQALSYVGLHSDVGVSGARLVVFLERGWRHDHGGHFVLAKEGGRAQHLAPLHNTGVLLSPATDDLHGVTNVSQGTRYSLVFELDPAS